MAIDFGNYANSYAGNPESSFVRLAEGLQKSMQAIPTKSERLARFDNTFIQDLFSGMGGKFDTSTGQYSAIAKNPNYNRWNKENPFINVSGFNYMSKDEALNLYLDKVRKKFGRRFAKKMVNPLVFSNKYDQFTESVKGNLANQVKGLKASSKSWTDKKLYKALENNPGMLEFMKQHRMFEDPELKPILGPHTWFGDEETSTFGKFLPGLSNILPTQLTSPGGGDPDYMVSDLIKWGALIGGGKWLYNKYGDKAKDWKVDSAGNAVSPDGKIKVPLQIEPQKIPKRFRIPQNLGTVGPSGQPIALPSAATTPQIGPVNTTTKPGIPQWHSQQAFNAFAGDINAEYLAQELEQFKNRNKTPFGEYLRKKYQNKPVSEWTKGDLARAKEIVVKQNPKLRAVSGALEGPINKIEIDNARKSLTSQITGKKDKLTLFGNKVPAGDIVPVRINKNGELVRYKPGAKIPNNAITVPYQVIKDEGLWKRFLKENFLSAKGLKNLVKGGVQYAALTTAGGVAGQSLAESAGSENPEQWSNVGSRTFSTAADAYFLNQTTRALTGSNPIQLTKASINAAKSNLPKLMSALTSMYKEKGGRWIAKKALTRAPWAAAKLAVKGAVGGMGSPSVVIPIIMGAWSAYDAYQLVKALTEAYEAEKGPSETNSTTVSQGSNKRVTSTPPYQFGSVGGTAPWSNMPGSSMPGMKNK